VSRPQRSANLQVCRDHGGKAPMRSVDVKPRWFWPSARHTSRALSLHPGWLPRLACQACCLPMTVWHAPARVSLPAYTHAHQTIVAGSRGAEGAARGARSPGRRGDRLMAPPIIRGGAGSLPHRRLSPLSPRWASCEKREREARRQLLCVSTVGRAPNTVCAVRRHEACRQHPLWSPVGRADPPLATGLSSARGGTSLTRRPRSTPRQAAPFPHVRSATGQSPGAARARRCRAAAPRARPGQTARGTTASSRSVVATAPKSTRSRPQDCAVGRGPRD